MLNAGRVEQVGTPLELYEAPASRFVAGFIGSPRMNFIEGTVAQEHGAHCYGIRPEHVELSREKGLWRGQVVLAEQLGSDTFVHIATEDAGLVNARAIGNHAFSSGDIAYVTPRAERAFLFDAEGRPLARKAAA